MSNKRFYNTIILVFLFLSIGAALKMATGYEAPTEGVEEEAFWTLKTYASPIYQIVIMGDSSAYYGISPEIIQEVMPEYNVLNFAYSAGGFNQTMYDAAESKLAIDSSMKCVVFAISPLALTSRAMANGMYNAEKSRSREYVFQMFHPNPLWNLIKPIGRKEINYIIKRRYSAPVLEDNRSYFPSGWAAINVETGFKPAALVPVYRKLYENYKVETFLVDQLMKKTREWNKKNLQVFAVLCPRSDAMKKIEAELGGFQQKSFVSKFEKAGGKWISLEGVYQTADGIHLPRKEAIRFSRDLGEALRCNLKQRA